MNPKIEALKAMYMIKRIELLGLLGRAMKTYEGVDPDTLSEREAMLLLAFNEVHEIADHALTSITLICDNAKVIDKTDEQDNS